MQQQVSLIAPLGAFIPFARPFNGYQADHSYSHVHWATATTVVRVTHGLPMVLTDRLFLEAKPLA